MIIVQNDQCYMIVSVLIASEHTGLLMVVMVVVGEHPVTE